MITTTMTRDHRHCDEAFAAAEEAVAENRWADGASLYATFLQHLEQHFEREESVLFPGFEQRTGHTMGPTQMMRMEHQQMRALLAEMTDAVALTDSERYLGLSETLMMVMQQHNMKEEQMLYPMVDQAFGDEAAATLQQMGML